MRNLEDILHDIGGAGRFQVFMTIICTLPKIPIGWSMFQMSFANLVPEWCCKPDEMTELSDRCSLDDPGYNSSIFAKECSLGNSSNCNDRVFVTDVRTIVNEWDLVCDRKWMVPLTTSLQMAGVLVGALVGGQLTDLIGRKKTMYLSIALGSIVSIIAGFSVNWEMFTAFRFLIGVTIGGHFVSGNPYMMEFFSPSMRAIPGYIPGFAFGPILLSLTAWRLHDWRWAHWICGALKVPLLFSYFFIPESLRWLAVKGRVDEAQKVVEYVARWNRRQVPKDSEAVLQALAADAQGNEKRTQYTYIHIYKGWNLFKTSVILQFLWFSLSLCNYGLGFGASAIGFSVYLNIFLMAVVSMPFSIVVGLLINKLGRKRLAALFFTLASLSGFGSLAVLLTVSEKDTLDTVIMVLSIAGKCFISAAWTPVLVLTSESYPTYIRGVGYGASNVIARVGGILAPFALNLEDMPNLAFSLVGGISLLCVISVYFLEETTGKAMPDFKLTVSVIGEKQPQNLDGVSSNGTVNKTPALADKVESDKADERTFYDDTSLSGGGWQTDETEKRTEFPTGIDNEGFILNTKL